MGVNYLRKIDTFGVPIDLCFEKKKMHKTPWGGFWTLIIFIFSLIVFIILGLEIVYRQKPNVLVKEQLEINNQGNSNGSTVDSDQNDSQIQLQNKSRASYSSQGIILALAALDSNYNMIEKLNDYFEITGYIVEQRGFQLLSQNIIIEFEYCNKLDFFQNASNQQLFSEFDLSYLMCMSNQEQLNYYLTGELGSELYNHIQIKITYKLPINLEIQNKLAYVALFFTDSLMDVQNYSKPLTKYRKNIIQKISANSQYEITIRNQHAQIKTDQGIIWSDFFTENFFFFQEYKINMEKADGNVLLIIKTETDPKLLVYTRSYMKITDILATIGGFIKTLLIGGFILANPVSKLSLKTELINRLFNFEGIEEQRQNENNNQKIREQEEYRMSKGFSKIEVNNENQIQNDKTEIPSNQITLNFLRNNSIRNNTQHLRSTNKEGAAVTNTESLNTTAAQPILFTHPVSTAYQSHLQQAEQADKLPSLSKNTSQTRLNQLSLLKIARRKNQSLNDLSTMGLPQLYSKKSISPLVSQQNQQQVQKDKVKLVRTMLKSFVHQRSMKPEDCMKASTILGTHKKEDPDAVFKKLFKSNEKTLTLKLWDYLKYFLGLKKEVKNKQIKFSMRKVNERLDIVFIMKKLIEVDKMKMLFLNENQRKIFEYLPRPIVRLDPDQHQEEYEKYTLNQAWARQMFFNDKNYISKASEAMLAYQDILQKGNSTIDPLDQKLIEMLDESKKQFFQVDSPIISPNGCNKRNSLSVIKSINHSSKKNNANNNVLLTGLQNISPAESIELNEDDLKEIKTQEIIPQNQTLQPFDIEQQHPNIHLQMYDNTRCFNKKNTMHFMKQNNNLHFNDFQLEQNQDEYQQYRYPPANQRNHTPIQDTQQDKFNDILDSLLKQQQSQQEYNQYTKVSNDKIAYQGQANTKSINQVANANIEVTQFNSSFQKQSFRQQQQLQSVSCINDKKQNNEWQHKNNVLLSLHSIQQDLIPQIPNIEDAMKDINVPKNTFKCAQTFSPTSGYLTPLKNKIKQSSDQKLEESFIGDQEINSDYDRCRSPGEEEVKEQSVKDIQMHPSNYHAHYQHAQLQDRIIHEHSDIESGIPLNKQHIQKNKIFQQLHNNYAKVQADHHHHDKSNCNINGNVQSLEQNRNHFNTAQYQGESAQMYNQNIQMETHRGMTIDKENHLLNKSIEPFIRYAINPLIN